MEFENIKIKNKQEVLRRKEFLVFLSWIQDFKQMYNEYEKNPEHAEGIRVELDHFFKESEKFSLEDFKEYIATTIYEDRDAEDFINNETIRNLSRLRWFNDDLNLEKNEDIIAFRTKVIDGFFGAIEKHTEFRPKIVNNEYNREKLDEGTGKLLSTLNEGVAYFPQEYQMSRESALNVFSASKNYLGFLENSYNPSGKNDNWPLALINLSLAQTNPDEQKEILEILDKKLDKEISLFADPNTKDREKEYAQKFILRACGMKNAPEIYEKSTRYLNSLLGRFGLNMQNISESWFRQEGEIHPSNILEHIDRMNKLEDVRPGAVKALHSEFGLTLFKKYPLETLINQYDQKDSDFPYGIYVTTLEDSDRALTVEQRFLNYKSLSESGNLLRFVEFKSTFSLLKRLALLNNRYGEKNKIGFAILNAHGSKDSIVVGGKQSREIESKDLDDDNMKMLGSLFAEHPNILLLSCDTGKEEGIAQTLSGIPGAKVIAPNVPINNLSAGIAFVYEDGKPVPKPWGSSASIYETYSAKSKV